MTIASFEDTWRVRLLSMPQQRQAATTSNAWGESEAPPGCQERSTPPTTMATMPSTMCRSAFSLKTTHAITAVSTPSTLRSKDAVAPDVSVRPHIRSAGPSIPPNSTAPRSHGMSFFEIPTAGAWSGLSQSCRMASNAPRPMPLPRYSSPANNNGGTSPTRSLAKGVLAPKRRAAARAGDAERTDMG